MLKIAHTLDVRSFHAAELALPAVERGAADAMLPAYVLGSPSRFDRLEKRDDLVLRKTVTSSWRPPGGWFTRSLQF